MSKKEKPEIGSITWCDLTIPDAENVKDFYNEVIGWKPEPVSMGDYNDYNMIAPESGKVAAGVCHKRGTNAELPSQWMVYFTVADVEKSAANCTRFGGKLVIAPKKIPGYGSYCIIQDPAGAVCALFAPEE